MTGLKVFLNKVLGNWRTTGNATVDLLIELGNDTGSPVKLRRRTERTVDVRDFTTGTDHPIVVSANPSTHGLMIVRGIVNSGGTTFNGEGFSASNTSTGNYEITYSAAFVDQPAVIVTQSDAVVRFLQYDVGASSASLSVIRLRDEFSSATNGRFSFLAIGQRGA